VTTPQVEPSDDVLVRSVDALHQMLDERLSAIVDKLDTLTVRREKLTGT